MKQQLDLFGQHQEAEAEEEKKPEVFNRKQVTQHTKQDINFTCKPPPYTFHRETPTITWVWNKKE